jgi:hypothetical protein
MIPVDPIAVALLVVRELDVQVRHSDPPCRRSSTWMSRHSCAQRISLFSYTPFRREGRLRVRGKGLTHLQSFSSR